MQGDLFTSTSALEPLDLPSTLTLFLTCITSISCTAAHQLFIKELQTKVLGLCQVRLVLAGSLKLLPRMFSLFHLPRTRHLLLQHMQGKFNSKDTMMSHLYGLKHLKKQLGQTGNFGSQRPAHQAATNAPNTKHMPNCPCCPTPAHGYPTLSPTFSTLTEHLMQILSQ